MLEKGKKREKEERYRVKEERERGWGGVGWRSVTRPRRGSPICFPDTTAVVFPNGPRAPRAIRGNHNGRSY